MTRLEMLRSLSKQPKTAEELSKGGNRTVRQTKSDLERELARGNAQCDSRGRWSLTDRGRWYVSVAKG